MSNRVRPLLSGDTYGARAEARCTVARNRPSVRPDCFPIIVTLPMLSFSGNLFAPAAPTRRQSDHGRQEVLVPPPQLNANIFIGTAVQDRHRSSDPCCKRGLCVPGTGILRSR